MRAFLIAFAASALAAGSASAAEIDINDEDGYDDGPYYEEPGVTVVEPADPGTVVEYGPRVYGWSYELRPENCGTFKYWNGEYCADARFDPPDED